MKHKKLTVSLRHNRHIFESIEDKMSYNLVPMMSYIQRNFKQIKREEDPIFVDGIKIPRIMNLWFIMLNFVNTCHRGFKTNRSGEIVTWNYTSDDFGVPETEFSLDGWLKHLNQARRDEFQDFLSEVATFHTSICYTKTDFFDMNFLTHGKIVSPSFIKTDREVLSWLISHPIFFCIEEDQRIDTVFETFFYEKEIPETLRQESSRLIALLDTLTPERVLSHYKKKLTKKHDKSTKKVEDSRSNKGGSQDSS
uniref:Uncharacterized protein n=1 Tax=viral metagenome TaxID=1070528 RepID=A0A2V0R999_9ZZZZ